MNDTLLQNALRGNAAFSAVSAFVLLLGGSALAEWIGVPTPVVYVLGVGLLPWAGFAWWTAQTLDERAVALVIAGDALWVIAAIVVIALRPGDMTDEGVVGLAVISVAVAAFGVAQTIGLRRLRTA